MLMVGLSSHPNTTTNKSPVVCVGSVIACVVLSDVWRPVTTARTAGKPAPADGETDDDGETDGESLEDGDVDCDGDRELLGERDADSELDGDVELDGLTDDEKMTGSAMTSCRQTGWQTMTGSRCERRIPYGELEPDGDTEALSLPTTSSRRMTSSVVPCTVRRMFLQPLPGLAVSLP